MFLILFKSEKIENGSLQVLGKVNDTNDLGVFKTSGFGVSGAL